MATTTSSHRYIMIAGIIEVISVVVTLATGYVVDIKSLQTEQLSFERKVERGMNAAESRLQQYELALVSAAGLFHSSQEVTRNEWRTFVEAIDIDLHYPGISGFGFIRVLNPTDIPKQLAHWRSQFGKEFNISTLDTVPEGNRFIIDFIEPESHNHPAIGLDVGSNPIRRAACNAAVNSGQAALTDIITLVQDEGKKPGFLMLQPVFRSNNIPKSPEERWKKIEGFAYAPFVAEDVLKGIDKIAGENIYFSLYDSVIHSDKCIYHGNPKNINQYLHLERNVNIGGRNWIFQWHMMESKDVHDEAYWITLLGLVTSIGLLIIMILLHRDSNRSISQLQTHETELLEANKRTKLLAQKAISSNEAKSRFLSSMSHELRTPLNAIIGFSKRLLNTKNSDLTRQQQAAEAIHRNGHQLLDLINNILDLSKIEAGRESLNISEFDLSTCLRDVIASVDSLLAEKKLKVIVRTPLDIALIQADQQKIRQVLLNIYANAIRYSHDGTITCSIERDHQNNTPGYIIRIQDEGRGISATDQEHIFESFYQSENTSGSLKQGTGLGLALCKELVELHNGNIEVSSILGQGSIFHIYLPTKNSNEEQS